MYKDVRMKIYFRNWLKCKLGIGSIEAAEECLGKISFQRNREQLQGHLFYRVGGEELFSRPEGVRQQHVFIFFNS